MRLRVFECPVGPRRSWLSETFAFVKPYQAIDFLNKI